MQSLLPASEHGDPLLLGGLLLLTAVAAARLARRLGLPSLTGYLAAGVAVGAVWPGTTATGTLAAPAQAAGAVLLFWIGGQVNDGVRPRGRLTAWLAAPALATAAACGIALAVTMPLGERSWSHVVLAALALTAASPTIAGLVSRDVGAGDRHARASIAATVAVNAMIVLAVLALLSVAEANKRDVAEGIARDLAAGIGIGAALAVIAARAGSAASCTSGSKRPSCNLPAWGVCLAASAFLILRHALVHHELAIMAGSWCAGAVFASACERRARCAGVAFAIAGRERVAGQPIPVAVGVASAFSFAVAGIAIDVPDVVAVAAPAAAIAGIRASALWLAAKIAGAVAGTAAAGHLGFAALLPQGELSLVLLAALAAAEALPAPLISLVLAVAAINLVAGPPLLRLALHPAPSTMNIGPNTERS